MPGGRQEEPVITIQSGFPLPLSGNYALKEDWAALGTPPGHSGFSRLYTDVRK
jgi:hypothetical protein